MKKFALIFLAILLLLAATVVAQDKTKPEKTTTQGKSAKAASVTGTVSLDGKTLVSDEDNMWTIDNTDALKGHEGQHVTVKCQIDTGKHAIHVLFITPEREGMKQAAKIGDSAFRR
jgi:membrane protein implicated in regulation of membrane protease activity